MRGSHCCQNNDLSVWELLRVSGLGFGERQEKSLKKYRNVGRSSLFPIFFTFTYTQILAPAHRFTFVYMLIQTLVCISIFTHSHPSSPTVSTRMHRSCCHRYYSYVLGKTDAMKGEVENSTLRCSNVDDKGTCHNGVMTTFDSYTPLHSHKNTIIYQKVK